ncbi:MAG: UDP-N-acetylglucosamine--N-acetylmuramyl-(pentapeptide) pyrophosphoryl-undecaprenol N-acetylglucosamine transferase [Candidatus Chisholmbacteria bacterium]|nr:UDP-N-acetylglucosamine--N-acetylmuramyl-(pentapeptide) pyrophosphoryl-undecaprenol N-acetylglucosamine transferase [Candidatus Chisholmbacteria bacterium]
MTIIFTGGHLTPALAVIDTLRHDHPSWRIIFIGRRFTGSTPAQESRLITSRGLLFLPLISGKLHRHFSLNSLTTLFKLPLGFWQALVYLLRYRPQLVVSFGSYLAVPVSFAAAILKIPILTHEQSTRLGLANRLIARVADKVAISWPTSQTFPAAKTVLTGNPLRQTILDRQTRPPFPLPPHFPIIYVTGGNQGSQTINNTLLPILTRLLRSLVVIHQTGLTDESRFQTVKAALPHSLQNRYWPQSWFDDHQTSWCLHHANLVVSRAGANITTELAFTGTPALLIPLPRVQQQEQLHNGQLLEAAGTARVLLQTHLTPQTLFTNITDMLGHQLDFRRHRRQARQLVDPQATSKLVRLIYELVKTAPPRS